VSRRGAFGALATALVLLGVPGTVARAQTAAADTFDHAKHAKVFPSCVGCHAGAAQTGAPLYPDAASCAWCHDGTLRRRVTYAPPADSMRTNLRFSHVEHRRTSGHGPGAAPAPDCVACHAEPAAPWMAVGPPLAARCLDCHGVRTAHLAAPDTACAKCHVALPEAQRLAAADVAKFPEPPSHRAPGFASGAGHGAAAKSGSPVAASCAVCHARQFCLECHVDAPERAAIQALASDPRSAAIRVTLAAPATHAGADFLRLHGAAARAPGATCATCHTRESCLTCHAATPQVAAAVPAAAPERGRGAVVRRHQPPSHTPDFVRHHAPSAQTAAASCASCHSRADCLQCHRPDAGRAAGYHPAGFLSGHPAAAYARQSSCSECHNAGQFCVSCHKTAGLVATGPLRSGYHDASRFFSAGHGVAARQSLETCVSCHAERDCLTCHSTVGGRRINPHGPGFDANRMRLKNPEVCTVCHGTAIPVR
jgi:hypothetical protein